MRADSVYDRWQAKGVNNSSVMGLTDFFCGLLPLKALSAIADACQDWYLCRHPELLSVLEGNLRGAFPAWSREEVASVAARIPVNYCRGVVDYMRAGRYPPQFVYDDGPGVQALRRSGSKIVVTAHMGNWEVGGFFLGSSLGPHTILAFPERDPGVDRLRDRKREDFGLTSLRGGQGVAGLMGLRALLGRGETIIVLCDRAVGKDRQEVSYCGRRADFLRSPGLLCELTGVPLIPVAVMAEGQGSYRAMAGPPVLSAGDPAAPIRAAADFFNAVLERYPDQWYNFFPYWEEP